MFSLKLIIRPMGERFGFRDEIEKLFKAWNEGNQNPAVIAQLNAAIKFAQANGIDLELTITADALKKEGDSRPMSPIEAPRFCSYSDETSFTFSIPSNNEMRLMEHKDRNSLTVLENYRELGSVMLLKNKVDGVFGTFLPGEIASISLK